MGLLRVGHDWTTSLSLFTFYFHALEKEMANHSTVLAWRIPGTEEPGGLQSMGSHRVGHNWCNLAAAVATAGGSMGFPGGPSGKEPTCQCRRHKKPGFNPWVRKSPWRRAWKPIPLFLAENSMDRGAWWATVHRVTKSQTGLQWLSMHACNGIYNIPSIFTGTPILTFILGRLLDIRVFFPHKK